MWDFYEGEGKITGSTLAKIAWWGGSYTALYTEEESHKHSTLNLQLVRDKPTWYTSYSAEESDAVKNGWN